MRSKTIDSIEKNVLTEEVQVQEEPKIIETQPTTEAIEKEVLTENQADPELPIIFISVIALLGVSSSGLIFFIINRKTLKVYDINQSASIIAKIPFKYENEVLTFNVSKFKNRNVIIEIPKEYLKSNKIKVYKAPRMTESFILSKEEMELNTYHFKNNQF